MNCRRILIYITAAFSLFAVISPGMVSADEIVLANGDRLTGKVKEVRQGALTLETEHLGRIHIDTSLIKSLRTDGILEIHLVDGELLKGRLTTDESGALTIEATDKRGASVLGWDKIAAVNTSVSSGWKGSVNAGATIQTGNSDRTNITFGAEATKRSERDRYNLRFLYDYAKEESNVTARSYYGAGKYDYFFTEKVYGYLAVELLKDKTKDLQLRTVVGPGAGYQFWDDEVKSLLFEAGISYFSENLEKGEDKDWISARLAADLRYTLTKGIVFSDQLILYPSLERARDYKLRNEAALTSPLSGGWSLRLANILDHDGNPPEDVKRNDWYWILALQYSFQTL